MLALVLTLIFLKLYTKVAKRKVKKKQNSEMLKMMYLKEIQEMIKNCFKDFAELVLSTETRAPKWNMYKSAKILPERQKWERWNDESAKKVKISPIIFVLLLKKSWNFYYRNFLLYHKCSLMTS